MKFRKYVNENDPSSFMGEIKKMSFHADNMDLPISFQRKNTENGEVQLMRAGGIDYVTISPSVASRRYTFTLMPAPDYPTSISECYVFIYDKNSLTFLQVYAQFSLKDHVLSVVVPIQKASFVSAGTSGDISGPLGTSYAEVTASSKLYFMIGNEYARYQHFSSLAQYIAEGYIADGNYDFYQSYTHYDGVTQSTKHGYDGSGSIANIYVNNISYFPSTYIETTKIVLTILGYDSLITPRPELPIGQLGLYTNSSDWSLMPIDVEPDYGLYIASVFSGTPTFYPISPEYAQFDIINYGFDPELVNGNTILNGEMSIGNSAGITLGFTASGEFSLSTTLNTKSNFWPNAYVRLDSAVSFINPDSFWRNLTRHDEGL